MSAHLVVDHSPSTESRQRSLVRSRLRKSGCAAADVGVVAPVVGQEGQEGHRRRLAQPAADQLDADERLVDRSEERFRGVSPGRQVARQAERELDSIT